MQHKVSNPGGTISPRRGAGCESVNENSEKSVTGIIEGEYLMIYEGKPSYKLIINSNNKRYRVSGYDECKEGETITCIRKDAEIGEGANKKLVYWYTMESVVSKPQSQPQPEQSGVGA
jgi:hypothetical protein